MKNKYTKEDVVITLTKFKQLAAGEYTKKKYIELGLKPTYPTICSLYEGGWKEALNEAGITPKPVITYTNEEMIKQLKECYLDNNNNISHSIYRNSKRKPSITTIEKHFGSFRDALIAAGIKPNSVQSNHSTDDEIIQALRDYYEENGVITYNSYEDSKRTPSASVIRKRFKTWNKALEAAGIPLNQDKESRFTESEIITALCRVAELVPHVVSKELYKKYALSTEPSMITIVRHFKTWNNALKKARLPIIPSYSKETILISLGEFFECYGEEASNDLYRKIGWLPGQTTINRFFGTWENAIKEIDQSLKYSHYTKEYAIEQIRSCAKTHGEHFSHDVYIEEGYKPSMSWIKKNFGSWTNAKKMAGLG